MKTINIVITVDDNKDLCHNDCQFYIKGEVEDNCDLFSKQIIDMKRCKLCLFCDF